MSAADLLIDGFGRIREIVHEVLDGLTDADLHYHVEPAANTIGWQIWHLTRVQDDHVAVVAGLSQVWLSGWEKRFGLPLQARDTGYSHSADQMASVRATGDLLAGYHDATYEQTIGFVRTLTEDDMSRIVDRSWQPPVTLGVRFVSVLSDDLQHAGQAAFVRGLIERGR